MGERRKLKGEIMKRKLQYCGHVIRAEGYQKKLLDGEVEGRRGRGSRERYRRERVERE